MRALYAAENKPQDETDKWIAPIVALKKKKKTKGGSFLSDMAWGMSEVMPGLKGVARATMSEADKQISTNFFKRFMELREKYGDAEARRRVGGIPSGAGKLEGSGPADIAKNLARIAAIWGVPLGAMLTTGLQTDAGAAGAMGVWAGAQALTLLIDKLPKKINQWVKERRMERVVGEAAKERLNAIMADLSDKMLDGEIESGEVLTKMNELKALYDSLHIDNQLQEDREVLLPEWTSTLGRPNPVVVVENPMAGRPIQTSTPTEPPVFITNPITRATTGSGNLPSGLKLTAERGAGKKNLNMFELFKGTGSVGKVAKRMGFNVVSLDFDPIYTPDIETDILKWDYKKWAADNNFIPDYIWSSPPCNTYSTLAYRLKERNTKTAEPKSARAREGTAILHKTLEIIKYFQSKNPKMLYTIENPRGMMRHDKKIKTLPNRETTLYCLYGDFKRKPTDFWSNFPMGLKPHTEKCMGKNVISNLANLPTIEQRYSIPSKLIRKILTEAKEQYGDEPMMGAGFFGDMWNAAKAVGKKVIGTIRNVVATGVRQDYPPYVRSLLSEIGDKPITEMYVRREPIQSLLNKALNFITRGKWNEAKSKYSYDSLFHLGLEVVVRMSESNNINKRYVIEKNEVIEVSPAKAFGKDAEIMPVSMNGQGHTINGLLKGARAILGGKFFPYDPFYNNCQDFIMAILTGSGLGNQEVYSFVKQPIEQLVKELPAYTGVVAKTITDLGGLANTAIFGQGGMNPSRKFANQLKKWNVNPTEYLEAAKEAAKKKGLPENMLGFSSDDKHKLQMPNADGKIIRFGAVGLGDYILYTLSKDAKADDHRRRYLARATKIKGDWKKDPFSPNNLAINVLW